MERKRFEKKSFLEKKIKKKKFKGNYRTFITIKKQNPHKHAVQIKLWL